MGSGASKKKDAGAFVCYTKTTTATYNSVIIRTFVLFATQQVILASFSSLSLSLLAYSSGSLTTVYLVIFILHIYMEFSLVEYVRVFERAIHAAHTQIYIRLPKYLTTHSLLITCIFALCDSIAAQA